MKSYWGIVTLILAHGCVSLLAGVEYHVSHSGDDGGDGLSWETSFRTVQRGLDALEAGDILTIGPGEYFGGVSREGLGSAEVETVIRAAKAGTVLLRGDRPAPEFDRVDGYRHVYGARFSGEVEAVNETDTLRVFRGYPALSELEFNPGSFHYHEAEEMLYISSSDYRDPGEHRYTVAVESARAGIYLYEPVRVVIEGIAVTGFNNQTPLPGLRTVGRPADQTAYGIFLARARECVIRDCVAYLNGGGIVISSRSIGGHNVIEGCTAFGNQAVGIAGYHFNHDIIRDSYAYRGGSGIRFYLTGEEPECLQTGNLVWGFRGDHGMGIKGGSTHTHKDPDNHAAATNSVVLGAVALFNFSNGLTDGGNLYNNDHSVTDIINISEGRIDRSAEFADPDNLDFRLLPGSRYRGAGEDGADLGPFPYQPTIYYLCTTGDDGNDGLSPATAWRTLGNALPRLRAGDTLYLEPGEYRTEMPWTVTGAANDPLFIRGRGIKPVRITGDVSIADSDAVVIERLNFHGSVTVADSTGTEFRNCRFSGPSTGLTVAGVDGVKIVHSEFSGFGVTGIDIRESAAVFFQGNVFANADVPAITADSIGGDWYSDYNSFANAARAWDVGGNGGPTFACDSRPQAGAELYSIGVNPVFEGRDGIPALTNLIEFVGRPLGRAIGIYREYQRYGTESMHIDGPLLHSVTDTTANFEWWSSEPATFEIAWGESPETETVVRYAVDAYTSFSLTDLQPGTVYSFQLRSFRLASIVDTEVVVEDWNSEPIQFATTTAAAESRELFVANDGSDRSDGTSRERAWRTLNHAADIARPGDTVWIAGGTYRENVRPRATGEAGRPITFRSLPGEKVLMDGGQTLPHAFSLHGKDHIHFDGLYSRDFLRRTLYPAWPLTWQSGVYFAYRSNHISISRCFHDGRDLLYTPAILRALESDSIELSNSVSISGWSGIAVQESTNIVLRNCVLFRPMIAAILAISAEPSVTSIDTIITEAIPSKVRGGLFSISRAETLNLENNCLYLRLPEEERLPFGVWTLGDKGYSRISLTRFRELGGDTGSILADPEFAVWVGVDNESDRFPGDLVVPLIRDFPDLFATNPEVVSRNIGLEPEAFDDFHFVAVDGE